MHQTRSAYGTAAESKTVILKFAGIPGISPPLSPRDSVELILEWNADGLSLVLRSNSDILSNRNAKALFS